MPAHTPSSPFQISNVRHFIAFRLFFNARFYYPIFTILFLDMGLTLEQFALLNSIWAITIVLAEVPSGAMADTIGRRAMVILATVCMIFEMAILCFVPLGNLELLFNMMLLNRVLSGFAQAMASGADEALTYDSLTDCGQASAWPDVLAKLMKYQAIAFLISMLLGAAVYDANWVNQVLSWLSIEAHFTAEETLRFPVYLTFISALFALRHTIAMKESQCGTNSENEAKEKTNVKEAFSLILNVGKWIMGHRPVWIIILLALLYDSIIRMFLTLNSEYYRLVDIPEAALGVMGALVSLVGFVIPAITTKMVKSLSPRANFLLLGIYVLVGLLGLVFVWPLWGIIPGIMVASSMFFLNFFISHYLNQRVESTQRATVLSFKGLACNLAYGAAGIAYMGITKANRAADPTLSSTDIFASTLISFPIYFAVVLVAITALLYLLPNCQVDQKEESH